MRNLTGIEIPSVDVAGEPHEPWLAAGTVCRLLDLHPGTLRRWRRQRVFPASCVLRIGNGEYRYRVSGILRALERRAGG